MAHFRDRSKIHHWSFGYAALKPVVVFFFRYYYRNIEVRNKKIIPRHQPVIFGPNHQNSLMDALAMLYVVKGQPVFLARADIFRKRKIADILHFLNMMPIFRIRDGMDSLAQNDEIFLATQQVLRDNHPMCLMPEGNHGDKRRLRQLVKGIFRIAFIAQKDYGKTPGVKIIPVGLDYSDYAKFHQTLFINIGQPIEVAEYYERWAENPALGMNELRERMSEEMRKLMIDIVSVEHYQTYQDLRVIYNERMRKTMGLDRPTIGACFDADKEMIRCLDEFLAGNPERMIQLNAQVADYSKGLAKYNLRDWVFRKKNYSIPVLILALFLKFLAFPVFIYGLLGNIIPYFIPVYLSDKMKDPQFVSSVRMITGMLIFVVYYLLLLVLAFIFLPAWWALGFLIITPIMGSLALRYFLWVKKSFAKWQYSLAVLRNDSRIIHMQQLRKEIIAAVDGIIGKYHKS